MLLLPLAFALLQPAANAPDPEPTPAPAPAPAAKAPDSNALKPAVPYPHPIITEVLFAVPTGAAGDANKDGKREVAGDEFVELVNPHERAIQLFGYTLTDSQERGKGQLRFTFPAVELPPGGVVVVFNGINSTWTGPIGDSKAPPSGPNEKFGNALAFTIRNANSRAAFGNSGDHVLLSAPDNAPVQRVYWSEDGPIKPEEPAPADEPDGPPIPKPQSPPKPLIEDFAPLVNKTSVHRDSLLSTGRFVSHMESEHEPFSPGVYVIIRPPAAPAAPAPAPPGEKPATP